MSESPEPQSPTPAESGESIDRVLRAMTDDGAFRIITARTTDTVRDAAAAQKVVGPDAASLGELLTAAILYRETMAPGLRVQLVMQGANDSGQLVADSNPDGSARAMCRAGTGGPVQTGEGALLQMMRSLPNGELHRGVVQVPEGGDISAGFMGYMELSEQTHTMAVVETVLAEDGSVQAAGGYLVQLLPEAPEREGAMMVMTERLAEFEDIAARLREHDADPQHFVDEIFYGMEFTMLHEAPLRFGCNCSKARVMRSLDTLDRDTLTQLVADGETLEMDCQHCNTEYRVTPAEVEAVLASRPVE